MSDICLISRFLHLIHPAHAVLFHRSNLLTEQDEVETWQRLDGWMVGDVVVYLLAGCRAQGLVKAGLQSFFIDESDVPEGEVSDDVMLHGFLYIVPFMDKSREWQVGTLAESHYCPREIYVFEVVLHSWDVLEPVLFRITSTRTFVL